MGWNWNDALGGAIDGFFSYGPYGAIAGGAAGGWSEDINKGITGDSNSGFVQQFYGARTGGAGSRILDSFDTNNGGRGGNQGTGSNEPAWGTSSGFTLGSLLGNAGGAAGQYFGGRYGMGGQGGQMGTQLGSLFGNAIEGREGTPAQSSGFPGMNGNMQGMDFSNVLPILLNLLNRRQQQEQQPSSEVGPYPNVYGRANMVPLMMIGQSSPKIEMATFNGIYG